MRTSAVRRFIGTTLALLFVPWNFVLPSSDGNRAGLMRAARYVFAMLVLMVLVWQLPATLRQAADKDIVLKILGGALVVEEILVVFLVLTPLMLWYRTGWQLPLVCIMYAIGAITFVEVLWAGAKLALAAFPNAYTNPYVGSCLALKDYSCREHIVLTRLQDFSRAVAVVELLWCALIMITLLAKTWSVPKVLTAAAVLAAVSVIAFFGDYLSLPLLQVHKALLPLLF